MPSPFEDNPELMHYYKEVVPKMLQADRDGYPYACTKCGTGLQDGEVCRCQEEDNSYDKMAEIAKKAGMSDLVQKAIQNAKEAPKVVADQQAELLAAAKRYGALTERYRDDDPNVRRRAGEVLKAAVEYWDAVK